MKERKGNKREKKELKGIDRRGKGGEGKMRFRPRVLMERMHGLLIIISQP